MRTTRWTKAARLAAGTLLVTAALGTAPAHAETWASDDCAGGMALVDTFTLQHYVAVRTAAPGPGTLWTCVRVDGSPAGLGGKLAITLPSGQVPGVPYTDTNAGACTAAPGNLLPGPHPVESGSVGDPSDPTYTPFLLDAYASTTEAWVCVRAGALNLRVVVPLGASVVPGVAFTPDPVGEHALPPPESPGYWSNACGRNAAVDGVVLYNGMLGTNYVLLAARAIGVGSAPWICVRVDGPVHTGGLLVIYPDHVTQAPLSALQVAVTSGGCGVTVVSLTNPDLVVSHSPTGSLPASVCLSTGGTTLRISLVNSGVPLLAEWYAD